MTALSTNTANPASPSVDLDLNDLAVLMKSMTEATDRLRGTHDVLQGEVSRLKAELADANSQLRRTRSLAALGEMAAGIAHEIRNPLGSIQLYAQALGEDLEGSPQAELCEKISRSVVGLDAIVRDVLSFARESRTRLEPLPLDRLVDAALRQCDGLLETAGIRPEVEVPGRFTLHADATLLTQAISNVVANAVEATVEQPARQLRVVAARRRVRTADGRSVTCAVIAIEDNGPGISREVVDRMFNPFFTTRATGTGLGLAIVHRIVDAHGGRIRVRTGDGGGACVELCIPLQPSRGTDAAEREENSPIIETPARRTREAV